jgi:hypothetical protein
VFFCVSCLGEAKNGYVLNLFSGQYLFKQADRKLKAADDGPDDLFAILAHAALMIYRPRPKSLVVTSSFPLCVNALSFAPVSATLTL